METNPEKQGADAEVGWGDKRVSIRNIKSYNSFVTTLTFIGVCVVGVVFYLHREDAIKANGEAREDRKETINAIKEQTTVQREGVAQQQLQNCLSKFPEAERQAQDRWCKTITGAR